MELFLGLMILVFCLSRNVRLGESGNTSGGVLLGINGEYGRASVTTSSSPPPVLFLRANILGNLV